MKAAGEKPVGKQPVAKPLNQQVEAAKAESDSKLMKQGLESTPKGDVDDDGSDITLTSDHDSGKEVADRMKAHGEKPIAKQPIAKPLNEQAEEAKVELLNN